MNKLNKAQEKRFDEKFYVFDKVHGYEVQFKGGSFTGSDDAYNFGKKLKQHMANELATQKEEIENMIKNENVAVGAVPLVKNILWKLKKLK